MFSSMSANDIAEHMITSALNEWDSGNYTMETRSMVDGDQREDLQAQFEKKYPEVVQNLIDAEDELISLRKRAIEGDSDTSTVGDNSQVNNPDENKGNDTKNQVQPVMDPATGYVNAVGDDDPAKSTLVQPPKPEQQDGDLDFVKGVIANPENFILPENLQKLKGAKAKYAGTENADLVSQAIKALQQATFKKLAGMVQG